MARVQSDFDAMALWSSEPKTLRADRDLDRILVNATRLPVRYWRPRMFFSGAPDKILWDLTQKGFPRKLVKRKRHPVFALEPLPNAVGCKVCPCSSKRPFGRGRFRYIEKGCRLLHTGYVMDRNSYLVEAFEFNIPESVARSLTFKGQAPESCVHVSKGATP